MKKFYFILLSAIIFGVVIVACTSQGDECAPISGIESQLQDNEPANTESDWAAFNQALDSLNAKYARLQKTGKQYTSVLPISPVADADAGGAVIGHEILRRFPNGSVQVEEVVVVYSVMYSFEEHKERTEIDTTTTLFPAPRTNPYTYPIYPPHSIPVLLTNTPCAEYGLNHNIIIEQLLNVDGVYEMSRQQLLNAIISIYNQEISLISRQTGNWILEHSSSEYLPEIDTEVQQTNGHFAISIARLDITMRRNYTDDYLERVNASTLNNHVKDVLKTYASVMYYSSSLWVAE